MAAHVTTVNISAGQPGLSQTPGHVHSAGSRLQAQQQQSISQPSLTQAFGNMGLGGAAGGVRHSVESQLAAGQSVKRSASFTAATTIPQLRPSYGR